MRTKAIQRRRAVADGPTLLRMALARDPGGLSLNQTAVWGSMIGMATMSDPAVKYRLDQAGDFLEAIMQSQLAACAGSANLHWPGRSLRAGDGSCIQQRASKGCDWRIHATFDLGRGGFSHLHLTDKHGGEHIGRAAPIAGEVRITDRNFANAAALQQFRKRSGDAADFIARARWKGFRLHGQDGRAFHLIRHLQGLPAGDGPHEVQVLADVPRAQGRAQSRAQSRAPSRLPLRLVILRKPAGAADATRQRLRRAAPRKQKQLDPRSLVAAGFLILATSLPAEDYPADEIIAAYRLRWQIELAFKRLKSLLHIDALPTRTPAAGSRTRLICAPSSVSPMRSISNGCACCSCC